MRAPQDASRFAELVLPHLDAGYNLARWLTRNPHDADDVIQDASLRALRYCGNLAGNDAKAWFLTVVRHAFHDWCRRNRPVQVSSDDDSALELAADSSTVDPEEAAHRSGESKMLAEAVAALPEAYREVLILRELEDLSYKEIARIVEVPLGTVMSRLARARSLLQRSSRVRAMGSIPQEVHDEVR